MFEKRGIMGTIMTANQAVAIIWALGTAAVAFWLGVGYAQFLNRDPLLLCDECRERRREGNALHRMAPSTSLIALGYIIAAALWPGLYLIKIGKWAIGKGWGHSCDRTRAAS
jgi:hypothetical protein